MQFFDFLRGVYIFQIKPFGQGKFVIPRHCQMRQNQNKVRFTVLKFDNSTISKADLQWQPRKLTKLARAIQPMTLTYRWKK